MENPLYVNVLKIPSKRPVRIVGLDRGTLKTIGRRGSSHFFVQMNCSCK
jgi:hypothetical protein